MGNPTQPGILFVIENRTWAPHAHRGGGLEVLYLRDHIGAGREPLQHPPGVQTPGRGSPAFVALPVDCKFIDHAVPREVVVAVGVTLELEQGATGGGPPAALLKVPAGVKVVRGGAVAVVEGGEGGETKLQGEVREPTREGGGGEPGKWDPGHGRGRKKRGIEGEKGCEKGEKIVDEKRKV